MDGTVETMERVLRQLEVLGESLQHSSIETLIENKLPRWILEKAYHQKKTKPLQQQIVASSVLTDEW
ncbi:unnamed protein product [Onchocerca flexuosa]|uniref:Transposase n=1 Tax=Onchocerca flexuosa TaxID=387005 RepID=A0A183HZD9_9BILA|nr:unnamed protein product [Onchocerca flexuosa]